LIIGEASGLKPQEIVLRFYDPSGTLLITRQNEDQPIFSYTSEKPGVHTVCIDNVSNEMMDIFIRFRSGVDAKDFSGIAETYKFKPIELDIYKIEELVKNIRRDTKNLITSDERRLRKRDKISSRMTFFSIITIVVVTVLASFQSVYLKSFFKSRKLL